MKKIALIIAMIAIACCAFAQTAALHGYMDYTNMAVGQEFQQAAGSNKFTATEASAEFGSFYNGRTEANLVVDAANFQFNLGIRLDASLDTWYDLYKGSSDAGNLANIIFHQGNMRVSFLNDQLRVYTGKFEEWNCGYIWGGYVLGGQNIRNVADRDNGQHFTGLEVAPYAVNGLRFMVGFPILPVSSNGVNYSEANQWKNLWKKVKLMASYKLPTGIAFNVGYRPETHLEGKTEYSADSLFGEAYLQFDAPYLIPAVPFNASFDFRYRKVDAIGKLATMYYFGISGKAPAIGNLNISWEDRFAYADDHYLNLNEKLIYNILGLDLSMPITGTDFTWGVATRFMFGADANGTAFSGDGRVNSSYCDDFALDWDWMPFSAHPATGSSGTYIGAYAYPYIQKGFANGYFKTGIEVQYMRQSTANSTQSIGYRVPVALCFWY
jgi:hypothetical protein